MWPTALTAVCILAAWRGRDDERLAAGGYLLNYAIGLLVYRARSEDTQWPVLFTDAALLALLVWIGLRSRRYWPLCAAGFQLLAVITHLASAIDPKVGGWAYLTAEILWSYLVIFSIGYGAWTAPRYATTDPITDPGATRR